MDAGVVGDLTDFAIAGRISAEIRALARIGVRVALVHRGKADGRLSSDIRALLREGLAVPLEPSAEATVRLAIDYTDDRDSLLPPLRLTAGRTVRVATRAPDQPVESTANVIFAGTNPWVRGALVAAGAEVLAEDWPAIAPSTPPRIRPPTPDAAVAIGVAAASDTAILPQDNSAGVFFIGRPARLPQKLPRNWRVFQEAEISLAWAVWEADCLVCAPGRDATAIPDYTVIVAASAGRPVLASPRLKPHLGDAATYADGSAAADILAGWVADGEARAAAGAAAREAALARFSEDRYLDVVAPLIEGKRRRARKTERSPLTNMTHPSPLTPALSPPGRGGRGANASAGKRKTAKPTASAAPPPTPPPVLFVASNGIGMGHVTRLLAIARRNGGRFLPVFATLAQAVHAIESFGYRAEYIPSLMTTGAPPIAWDDWFGFEIERLLAAYGAGLIVYDGNEIPAGMLRASMATGARILWVRRSMGPNDTLPPVETARFCEAIVEPGEIAAPRHFVGMDRKRRNMVAVEPIRLLDEAEALPRADAAAALGLDPDRPAVLVHLGAGSNRDVTPAIDAALAALRPHAGAQVAIAEWANAPAAVSLWPEALTVKGFPLARYYNAFDFALAAAGYNTFHETIAHGLPTVFIANTTPGMDDQIGRARFAQASSAAFELPEDKLMELPDIFAVLMSDRARAVLAGNCRALARPNGAGEAAAMVAERA